MTSSPGRECWLVSYTGASLNIVFTNVYVYITKNKNSCST